MNLADRTTGRIYARFAKGELEAVDENALKDALADAETHAALRHATPSIFGANRLGLPDPPAVLRKEQHRTLGRWGKPA